jgi:hypothetical protein
MALEPEEQEELAALVEEQSDIIREMAITQNAMLSLLLDKGYMTSEELEESRALIQKQIADA